MITDEIKSLFSRGESKDQIRFLDNFWEEFNPDNHNEQELEEFLHTIIKYNSSLYVKRSAFIILGLLTLSEWISNRYTFLSSIQNFLSSDVSSFKVIGLRYTPYFSELQNLTTIEQIKNLTDDSDGDVASEAFVCLGLFQLTSKSEAINSNDLIVILHTSLKYFQSARQVSENRDDAEFYIAVIEWCLELTSPSNSGDIAYKRIQSQLNIYSLYEHTEIAWQLHFLAFELIRKIQEGFLIAHQSKRWIDVPSKVKALMEVKIGILNLLSTKSLRRGISDSLVKTILKPLQEMVYRTRLSGEKERLIATKETSDEEHLVDFIEEILKYLPDEKNPTHNEKLLAGLVQSLGAEKGLSVYHKIQDKSASPEVIKAFNEIVNLPSTSYPHKTGSIVGEEILAKIEMWVDDKLPLYDSQKKKTYLKVVEEIIRYTVTRFRGSEKSRFPFLFAESEDGLGQKALERDLQEDMFTFFQHSQIADGLDHEKAKFVDGGRVDIVYKRDIITIPIELKRSLIQHTKATLEQDYIAQAQTYTAGHDQLGIFAVLELSDKSLLPPPDIRDWFHFHHLQPSTAMPLEAPDYIVSVIIPGNRTSPSAKSTYGTKIVAKNRI